MTWNISFIVEDGEIESGPVISGDGIPEGRYTVNGHHSDLGRGIALQVGRASVSCYIPTPEEDE